MREEVFGWRSHMEQRIGSLESDVTTVWAAQVALETKVTALESELKD